jgi:hypothetical protein
MRARAFDLGAADVLANSQSRPVGGRFVAPGCSLQRFPYIMTNPRILTEGNLVFPHRRIVNRVLFSALITLFSTVAAQATVVHRPYKGTRQIQDLEASRLHGHRLHARRRRYRRGCQCVAVLEFQALGGGKRGGAAGASGSATGHRREPRPLPHRTMKRKRRWVPWWRAIPPWRIRFTSVTRTARPTAT